MVEHAADMDIVADMRVVDTEAALTRVAATEDTAVGAPTAAVASTEMQSGAVDFMAAPVAGSTAAVGSTEEAAEASMEVAVATAEDIANPAR